MDEIIQREAGRPSIFSPALGQEICERIMKGRSLNRICAEDDDMPEIGTVFRWVVAGEINKTQELRDFAISYKEAMDVRAEHLFDQIIDLADYKGNDQLRDANGLPVFNDVGNPIIDHDDIQRKKLQIDTRLKYLSKLKPKKYGERTTLAGDADAPLQITGIKIELVPGVKE